MNAIFGKSLPIPTTVFCINKWQFLLLVAMAVLIAGKNFLLMVDGLGEADTARLMNDAIIWHHTDSLPFVSYRAKTSPGYLAIIKYFIDSGVSYEKIINILNSINAVIGAILIFISFFFFRLFFPFITAFACVIMLSFVPSVSVFSIYGFPTLLAYAAFYVSILLFVQSSVISPGLSLPLLIAAVITLSIGTILKADIILLAGGYLGVLVAFGRLSRATLLSGIFIIIIGAVAPLVFKHFLLPDTVSSVPKIISFSQNWSEQYPLSLEHFFSIRNIGITASSVGLIFAFLGVFGAIYSTLRYDTRRVTWVVILLALPLVLFWGARPGNSARHMLGLAIPTIVMVGILLQSFRCWRFSRSAILVSTSVAIVSNYFSIPASESTIAPSARLIESARMIRKQVSEAMKYGDSITKSREAKHYLIDSYTMPYSLYNVLKHSRSINRWSREAEAYELDISLVSGKNISLGWEQIQSLEHATALANQMRSSGFVVWSVQYPGI